MINILTKLIPENSVGIWWIGQGGFAFKTNEDKIIFIDPYLSNSIKETYNRLDRLIDIPIKPKEVITDLVLCTHNHQDHTDPVTLREIAQNNDHAKFIGPTSSIKHLKRMGIDTCMLIELNRGKKIKIAGVEIKTVFAKHTEDSIGYVLRTKNNITIYVTGDTEYDKELEKLAKYNPDIMITCINGKAGNMNFEEAAYFTGKIKPEIVIPMHYGMFKENTVDPQFFLHSLEKEKIKSQVVLLKINKCFLYSKVSSI